MFDRPGYMHWAKTHPPVRFELTDSGMATAELELLGATMADVALQVGGPHGDPRLIEAIANRYDVPAERVVPVPAASSGNFIAIGSVCRGGDTVLIEHPVYDPLARVASFLGLRAVPIHRRAGDGFALPQGVAEAARDTDGAVRAVIVTNPHNPSGRYEPPDRMAGLARACAEIGAHLIVDEAYLDGPCIVGERPMETAGRLGDNVVAINSLTKIYGLSGLRMGWVIAEPATADRARQVMDIISVNNAAPSTTLGLKAFERIAAFERRYREVHARGQRSYRTWLAAREDVRGYENTGCLFELLRLPEGLTADRFCAALRERYDTQVTPGGFFDLPDHVRLGLTAGTEALGEALGRIGQALDDLAAG